MTKCAFCLILILVYICVVAALSRGPITRVAQGVLEGAWVTTRNGRRVAAFTGIPYAQPPVGALRFQSPRPPKSWSVPIYNATSAPPVCLQVTDIQTTEDCLYLNVFTPNVRPRKKYAVLVYIHGGGFKKGTADVSILGPTYLLDENIILVTINYRLGILGFLSLEHPVLPGNLGLKDQREALRWIQKNLAAFGGDPDKVTISGNSAGGVSVHLLSIFAAKEGLFRAGIIDSKSASSLSGFQLPGTQRHYVEIIAEYTRCPLAPIEFVQCLRQVPAHTINKLNEMIMVGLIVDRDKLAVLAPMIEPVGTPDRLISADPLLSHIDIPLYISNTGMEGLLFTYGILVDKTNKLFDSYNNNPSELLSYYLQFDVTAMCPQAVSKAIKQFYLPGLPINRQNYARFVDIFSDAHYNYGTVLAARANKNTTYYSQINYEGLSIRAAQGDDYYGVSHEEDLIYLFPFLGAYNVSLVYPEDLHFSKTYVKLWTNFVQFLNPTPRGRPVLWTPVQTNHIEYLDIGQTSFVMKSNFLRNRMDFWDSLPYRNKYTDPQVCMAKRLHW